MTVVNWICGFIGSILLIVFLGKYAVSINSIPLWIIIVGVLILPLADIVTSARKVNGNQDSNRNGVED